ncbi:DUF3098 domain-containing protein [bacterium SCSIO 12741]|nr:DUF3098 domain-containing protein [bacterium SCSIO 12741]
MEGKEQQQLVFTRENYLLMIAGVAFVIIGFLLMAGGGSEDPNVFNADEIFSARRVTVAPLTILLGFGIVFFSILKKPGSAKK